MKHHSQPITSVEWHPNDSTVFASAGEDDQVREHYLIWKLISALPYMEISLCILIWKLISNMETNFFL